MASSNGYYNPEATLSKLRNKFLGPSAYGQQQPQSNWFETQVEKRTRPSATKVVSSKLQPKRMMPSFEGSESEKYKQAMNWCKQFIIVKPEASMPLPSGGFEFMPLNKICNKCGKNFDLKSYYMIHDPCYQRIHHECDICHRVFKDKDHLRAHVAIHFDPQYRCRREGCGKLSHTQFNAVTHERNIHSSFMPFVCNFEPGKCSKEFKVKDRCQRHILGKHFNYHPFTCSICGVGSVTADRKRIHEKRHLNPKQPKGSKNATASSSKSSNSSSNGVQMTAQEFVAGFSGFRN